MPKKLLLITIVLTLSFLQSACSLTKTLQTDRLNLAENYIIQTENILATSSSQRDKIRAEETLGTAKAYLETVRDNRKFLTDQEERRRVELKQRADRLSKVIYR